MSNVAKIQIPKNVRFSRAIEQLVRFSEARPTEDAIAVLCSDKADAVYKKHFPSLRRAK